MITTAAVLIGCVLGHVLHWQVDGWIGLLVALFILWSGWSAAKDTISPLLGEPASEELVQSISRLILSHEKILGIHDLMVHDYGPGQCFASVHAEMDSREDPLLCHDVLDDIERDALRELRVHLVIHYDPIVTDDAELNHMRTFVQETIRAIDPELTLHDFRMVRGAQHTTLSSRIPSSGSRQSSSIALTRACSRRIGNIIPSSPSTSRCAGREPVLAWNSGFIKQPAVESVKPAAGM